MLVITVVIAGVTFALAAAAALTQLAGRTKFRMSVRKPVGCMLNTNEQQHDQKH
jgi:hypothetical protein